MDWLDPADYDLARQVLQRGVALVFLVAFLSTFNQFPALLGERGLLPVRRFLDATTWRQAPSIFRWHYSDRFLRLVCLIGIGVAALLVLGIPQLGPPWLPLIAFLVLWALYLSIVTVGQTFYAFGWESLLLEAGFVVAFLGSDQVEPPMPILVFLWWLVFRLEFGAGMIKMRGGREWRDLTALDYHHETQPMPNPVSRFAHLLPKPVHRLEVIGNHVAQLGLPWLLFAPQPIASIAALLLIVTQGWLVVSGNFAWLNVLTVILTFSAVSDEAVQWLLPFLPLDVAHPSTPFWWLMIVVAVTAVLVVLSWWPAKNLVSRRQLMNASFNPLHLVNAYGAFGTVTKRRDEIVVEGTDDAPENESGWREYEFKGKPGDPTRIPRQFAPYHLRLDWLMWFLALGMRADWFTVFLLRLLEGDRATLRLLRVNPFPDAPARFVRARVFRYRFATRAERRETGMIWVREPRGVLVPPTRLKGRG